MVGTSFPHLDDNSREIDVVIRYFLHGHKPPIYNSNAPVQISNGLVHLMSYDGFSSIWLDRALNLTIWNAPIAADKNLIRRVCNTLGVSEPTYEHICTGGTIIAGPLTLIGWRMANPMGLILP
jgi:hypothetical protein